MYGSYLSCYQLTEDDILESTEQVRAEDDDDKDVPSLFNPGTVSLVNGGFAHAANGLSDAHPVRLIIFSVGSQHLGCLLASRTKASTPTLGMRNLRRNRRPAALVSSYTSGCRMRPHHGLLVWSKRRAARSSLELKSCG